MTSCIVYLSLVTTMWGGVQGSTDVTLKKFFSIP